MDVSAHDSLVLVGILAAGAGLLALAPILRVPYPILLVLGGLALGFVPGIPHVALRPDVVLVAILPPLLYSAAFFTSLRDLERNVRPLSLLAVGLVLATMRLRRRRRATSPISGLSWPVCFVLGALVAPTDAVAATAIASRLGLPRRLVDPDRGREPDQRRDRPRRVRLRRRGRPDRQLLALARDLALRRRRRSAGSRSASRSASCSARSGAGSNHSPTEIAIALLSGYFAYLPAEAAGVSAVLAAVTVSIYVGWYTPELTNVADAPSGRRGLGASSPSC